MSALRAEEERISTMAKPEDEGVALIKRALEGSKPRPEDNAEQGDKNKYAVRFADKIAELIAKDLQPRFQGIQATTQRAAQSVTSAKQLDVNFSTPQLGLALGISLKSVHFRDRKSKRYTHNMKRNEEELRIEAMGYHKRQPYAVMIGVLWLPFDSCEDGKKKNSSSFGSWVRHLRPFAGRANPKDDEDRFERIYIGLYETDGSALRFFDIESAPPKNARPPSAGPRRQRSLSYSEFLEATHHEYLRRNSAEFSWADGGEEPLAPNEIEPSGFDEESDDR